MSDAILTTKSISLDAIERKAIWIKADADDLVRYVNLLVSLPDYETKAEEAVTQAAAATHEALRKINEAFNRMNQLRSRQYESVGSVPLEMDSSVRPE